MSMSLLGGGGATLREIGTSGRGIRAGSCTERGSTGMPRKTFDPCVTRDHWPIIEAYKSKKVSLCQTRAQLKDLGMVEWEILLYLDNDQGELADDA